MGSGEATALGPLARPAHRYRRPPPTVARTVPAHQTILSQPFDVGHERHADQLPHLCVGFARSAVSSVNLSGTPACPRRLVRAERRPPVHPPPAQHHRRGRRPRRSEAGVRRAGTAVVSAAGRAGRPRSQEASSCRRHPGSAGVPPAVLVAGGPGTHRRRTPVHDRLRQYTPLQLDGAGTNGGHERLRDIQPFPRGLEVREVVLDQRLALIRDPAGADPGDEGGAAHTAAGQRHVELGVRLPELRPVTTASQTR
jgi:hypothetical protein